MKKWLSLPVLGLLISLSLNGQSGYRPGFVIKADKDTMNGLIYYGTEKSFGRECRFRRFDIAREVSYDPREIIGYGFRNGRYFESKKDGKGARFLECLLKGTISVYIHPGDLYGQVFIEHPDAGLFQLTKSRNRIEGVGDLGDYKAVLNWLSDKTGKSSTAVSNVQFSAVAIATYLRTAGTRAGYPEKTFARSESVHVLKDFSLVTPTSRFTIGFTGGYQYLKISIPGTNLTPFFRASDFNASYRPVAGLFLNRRFSKRSDRFSADLAVYYFQDTYYAYSEYRYEMATHRDDLLLDFQAIQVPLSLKVRLGQRKNYPFLRLGAYKSFFLSNSYERISERDDGEQIYTDRYTDYVFTSDYGFTGCLGWEFGMGKMRKFSLEAGYIQGFQKISLPGAKAIYNSTINSNGISLMARINL